MIQCLKVNRVAGIWVRSLTFLLHFVSSVTRPVSSRLKHAVTRPAAESDPASLRTPPPVDMFSFLQPNAELQKQVQVYLWRQDQDRDQDQDQSCTLTARDAFKPDINCSEHQQTAQRSCRESVTEYFYYSSEEELQCFLCLVLYTSTPLHVSVNFHLSNL